MEIKRIRYALSLDETNRITSYTFEQYADNKAIIVETLPDGNPTDYRYENGEFIHDPRPKPDPTGSVTYATYDELAAAIQEGVNSYGK